MRLPNDKEKNEEQEQNNPHPPAPKTTTTLLCIKFDNQIEKNLERYRFAYKKLKFKRRLERINKIYTHIITVCINKEEIKKV